MAETRARYLGAAIVGALLGGLLAAPASAMTHRDFGPASTWRPATSTPSLSTTWRLAGRSLLATVRPAPTGAAYSVLAAGATRGRLPCVRAARETVTCRVPLRSGFTVLAVEARRAGALVATSPTVTRRLASKRVYLTFDDGPWGEATSAVLDVLREHKAVGTFFVIGNQASSGAGLLRRMRAEGHAIGDHSWSHPVLSRRDTGEVRRELRRTQAAVAAVLPGAPLTCYRPPYGATSDRVRAVATDLGLREYLWSVDPTDWRDPGADVVARRIIGQLRPGSVVLLHDGAGHGRQAAAAIDQVLRHVEERGWTTATLPGC